MAIMSVPKEQLLRAATDLAKARKQLEQLNPDALASIPRSQLLQEVERPSLTSIAAMRNETVAIRKAITDCSATRSMAGVMQNATFPYPALIG